MNKIEVKHLASDYPSDVPTVHELLAHLSKKTGFNLEEEIAWYDGDRTAADFADVEPSNDEAYD